MRMLAWSSLVIGAMVLKTIDMDLETGVHLIEHSCMEIQGLKDSYGEMMM